MNESFAEFFDAFFKLDPQGRILTAQGKVDDLFQLPPADLPGRVIWEIYPDLAGGELDQKIQDAAAQRRTLRISGPLLPGTGWIEITLHPVADGVECYVRDISAYRQAQPGPTHDEKSRIIFDALLEFIPEGIIIADAAAEVGSYPFLVASRYASGIFDLPREHLLEFTLRELLNHVQFFEPGSTAPLSPEDHALTRFIEYGESTEDLEYDLVDARGRRTAISVKGGPIRNEDGQIIGGIFSWMDTSERQRQQNQLADYAKRLEQSNKDLESFAYSISHDLQEPLRKVIGFSDLLQRRYRTVVENEGASADELSGKDMLDRIHSASSRMQAMINDLLEYSRINTHETELTQVDLNLVMREVLTDLEATIERQQGQVAVDPLPVVYANPIRMQQLFLNLVNNAVKFHRPDAAPRVHLSASGPVNHNGQTWVQIAVADNGIGFDVSSLDKIVQPFQRLHGRGVYEGSGIGLAICRRIVDTLGGTLTAESHIGQGSTFKVTLPQNPPPKES